MTTLSAPSPSKARLWIAGVLLVIYAFFVLFVVLWPSPVDSGLDGPIMKILASLHRRGVPEWFGYRELEFSANIGMFVPLGFLIALVLPARLWWVSLVICVAFSAGIETFQGLFLSARYATLSDVISNSIGGLIGTLAAVILRAIVYQRDQRVIARALWMHKA